MIAQEFLKSLIKKKEVKEEAPEQKAVEVTTSPPLKNDSAAASQEVRVAVEELKEAEIVEESTVPVIPTPSKSQKSVSIEGKQND